MNGPSKTSMVENQLKGQGLRRSVRWWSIALEATLRLMLAQWTVRWLPLRWYARWLGEAGRADICLEPDKAALLRVRWALGASQRRLPWTVLCLPEAMAAKWMLAARGVSSTLYLGVKRGEILEAHAWLVVGGSVFTGDKNREGYAEVAYFS